MKLLRKESSKKKLDKEGNGQLDGNKDEIENKENTNNGETTVVDEKAVDENPLEDSNIADNTIERKKKSKRRKNKGGNEENANESKDVIENGKNTLTKKKGSKKNKTKEIKNDITVVDGVTENIENKEIETPIIKIENEEPKVVF